MPAASRSTGAGRCAARASRCNRSRRFRRAHCGRAAGVDGRARIDGLLTFGRGARVGIFGAPGIGKSTLLEHVVGGSRADAVVVALVGERGREAERWIERLDRRTCIVAATSDRRAGNGCAPRTSRRRMPRRYGYAVCTCSGSSIVSRELLRRCANSALPLVRAPGGAVIRPVSSPNSRASWKSRAHFARRLDHAGGHRPRRRRRARPGQRCCALPARRAHRPFAAHCVGRALSGRRRLGQRQPYDGCRCRSRASTGGARRTSRAGALDRTKMLGRSASIRTTRFARGVLARMPDIEEFFRQGDGPFRPVKPWPC